MKYAKPIGLLMLLMLAVSCAPTTTPQTGFDSMAQHNKIIYIREKGQTYTLSRYLKVVKDVVKRTETGLLTGPTCGPFRELLFIFVAARSANDNDDERDEPVDHEGDTDSGVTLPDISQLGCIAEYFREVVNVDR